MKRLLTIALTFLLSTAGVAQAESGFYFDPERSGEGMILSIEDSGRMGLAFFTYLDAVYAYPPFPGPLPPYDYFDLQASNTTMWYVGVGDITEGTGIGELFTSVPLQYPLTLDRSLAVEISFGDFTIIREGDGFSLQVACSPQVPPALHICNTTFHFTSKILGD